MNCAIDNRTMFVYGDNDLHIGKGGQACIRDMPNAMGVPTKKKPDLTKSAFYSDNQLEQNKGKIDDAFSQIKERLEREDFHFICFPEDGLGTGLAKLPECAPETFAYLNQAISAFVMDITKGSYDVVWNGVALRVVKM